VKPVRFGSLICLNKRAKGKNTVVCCASKTVLKTVSRSLSVYRGTVSLPRSLPIESASSGREEQQLSLRQSRHTAKPS
jgi:hypothetical protein